MPEWQWLESKPTGKGSRASVGQVSQPVLRTRETTTERDRTDRARLRPVGQVGKPVLRDAHSFALELRLRHSQLVDGRSLVERLVLGVDQGQLHVRGEEAEGGRQVEDAVHVQEMRAVAVASRGVD